MFKIWDNYAGWKVLELFLRNPTRVFYLRQAAKAAGVSTISASVYLGEYAKTGVLSRQKRANLLEFKLNEDAELPKILKKAFALHLAMEGGVAAKILKAVPYASTICLYGSYANGSYDEKSDFDLLVISPREEKGIKVKLNNDKEASILCLSLERWRKSSPDFKSSVLRSHVLLYGKELVEI